MPEMLFALGLSLATFAAAFGIARLACTLDSLRETLIRAEVRRSESLRLQQAEERIAEIQRLTECAVAGGTEVVRNVHRGIAAVPFGVLERIAETRDTARVVRKAHDLISDTVYGTIKAANRGIGVGVRQKLHTNTPRLNLDTPAEPSPERPKGQDR